MKWGKCDGSKLRKQNPTSSLCGGGERWLCNFLCSSTSWHGCLVNSSLWKGEPGESLHFIQFSPLTFLLYHTHRLTFPQVLKIKTLGNKQSQQNLVMNMIRKSNKAGESAGIPLEIVLNSILRDAIFSMQAENGG